MSSSAGAPAATDVTRPPAEQALRTALARHPNDPAAHEALGRYLLDEHRPFEALWHFQVTEDLRPHDRNATPSIARALIQAGLPADATDLLKASPSGQGAAASPAARPSGLSALPLAEAALATARPRAALAALAGAGPATSAPAALLLGDARYAAGDTAGAAAAYRRAGALDPESAAGYERPGRMALAARQWAAARQAFGMACRREPRKPGPLYRQGLAAAGAGDTATAERLWHQVVAMAPEYAPARVALGKLYYSHGQWRTAAAYLVQAARLDPGSEAAQLALADVMTAQGDRASACYQRGFSDLETDRPQQALEQFRRMTAAAPARVDGPLMVSLAYIKMQQLDRAAAEAQRGLTPHPGDARLLERLIQLHTISHNRPLARQIAAAWLRRDPAATEPSVLLTRIAREEERLPESQQWGERALSRAPEDAEACYQLSKTLSALGGPAHQRRALELARLAVDRSPLDADHWHQWGVALWDVGRAGDAAAALLRTLDLNPASVESCSLLVQVAVKEQRPDTSRFFAHLTTELEERARTGDALWRAVYGRPADAAAHARLAQFLLAQGDLRRAGYQLEQAAALDPADRASRRTLAVIQRLQTLQEP